MQVDLPNKSLTVTNCIKTCFDQKGLKGKCKLAIHRLGTQLGTFSQPISYFPAVEYVTSYSPVVHQEYTICHDIQL